MKRPDSEPASSADVVIIGAGVVGLSLAHRLARTQRSVVVLERERRIGMHTSSRSSEVIHAGLYYAPDSLKARMCVAGRKLLYQFCRERRLPHSRVGKLVVAAEHAQLGALRALKARALQNGVSDLTWLDERECRELEPELRAVAALLSPSTGILDSHAFLSALDREAREHGAVVALRTPFVAAKVEPRGFLVDYGGRAPGSISCAALINAGGLFAVDAALRIEGLARSYVPEQRYAKGHYFALSGPAPFSRLIYPLPDAHGLGIHVTLDLAGQVRFGPDVCWIDGPDYGFDATRQHHFEECIRRYYPGLDARRLTAGHTGVRPKLAGEDVQDFVVQGPQRHNVPGLVNLFGIESPGLTASLALAEHACALLSL